MSKNNPFNRDVPLQFLLSSVPSLAEQLPMEYVVHASEYKLRMADAKTKFAFGADQDGQFVMASTIYYIVK